MALHSTLHAVSFDALAEKYGAVDFQDALVEFIAQTNNPDASVAALRDLGANTLIPFHSVPVYHKLKFQSKGHPEVADSVHARPEQDNSRGCQVPSRFDTVLVYSKDHTCRNGGKVKFY